MLSRYVHIRSLQCIKITCKFTERFLRNQCFCRGTFFWPHPVYLQSVMKNAISQKCLDVSLGNYPVTYKYCLHKSYNFYKILLTYVETARTEIQNMIFQVASSNEVNPAKNVLQCKLQFLINN